MNGINHTPGRVAGPSGGHTAHTPAHLSLLRGSRATQHNHSAHQSSFQQVAATNGGSGSPKKAPTIIRAVDPIAAQLSHNDEWLGNAVRELQQQWGYHHDEQHGDTRRGMMMGQSGGDVDEGIEAPSMDDLLRAVRQQGGGGGAMTNNGPSSAPPSSTHPPAMGMAQILPPPYIDYSHPQSRVLGMRMEETIRALREEGLRVELASREAAAVRQRLALQRAEGEALLAAKRAEAATKRHAHDVAKGLTTPPSSGVPLYLKLTIPPPPPPSAGTAAFPNAYTAYAARHGGGDLAGSAHYVPRHHDHDHQMVCNDGRVAVDPNVLLEAELEAMRAARAGKRAQLAAIINGEGVGDHHYHHGRVGTADRFEDDTAWGTAALGGPIEYHRAVTQIHSQQPLVAAAGMGVECPYCAATEGGHESTTSMTHHLGDAPRVPSYLPPTHSGTCPNRIIRCLQCGDGVPAKMVEEHMRACRAL